MSNNNVTGYEERILLGKEMNQELSKLLKEKENRDAKGYSCQEDEEAYLEDVRLRYGNTTERFTHMMYEAFPYEFRNSADYIKYIQQPPEDDFIAERKEGLSQKINYVPIGVKEAIADRIFDSHSMINVDIKELGGVLISVTVDISYRPSYPDAEEFMISGGASMKISTAVTMAESSISNLISKAKSNAFSHIGNRFGRNLNRKLLSNDFTV